MLGQAGWQVRIVFKKLRYWEAPHKEAGRERSQLGGTNCCMMAKEKEHRQHAYAWIDIEGDPTRKKPTKLSHLQDKCHSDYYIQKDTYGKDS